MNSQNTLWYYRKFDIEIGPLSFNQLLEAVRTGQLREGDWVRPAHLTEWQPARVVPGLFGGGLTVPYSQPKPPPQPVRSPARPNPPIPAFPPPVSTASFEPDPPLPVPTTPSAGIKTKSPLSPTMKYGIAGCLGCGMVMVMLSIAAVSFILLFPSNIVSSHKDEQRIKEAVAFVVCGVKFAMPGDDLNEVPIFTGTGFVVSPYGYILTNKHVIADIPKVLASQFVEDLKRKKFTVEPAYWVFLNGKKYPADVVHKSKSFDLAVLSIKHSGSFFALSKVKEHPLSTAVYACGFPAAARDTRSQEEQLKIARAQKKGEGVEKQFTENDFKYRLTQGSINKIADTEDHGCVIDHSAQISGGNSGGPLILASGVVVGLNTFLTSRENRAETTIFYAISTEQLRQEIDTYAPGAVWR